MHDRLVDTIRKVLSIIPRAELETGLYDVVLTEEPLDSLLDVVVIDLREETDTATVDTDDHCISVLEGPQEGSVPSDHDDDVHIHLVQRYPLETHHVGDVLVQEVGVSLECIHDLAGVLLGIPDGCVRVDPISVLQDLLLVHDEIVDIPAADGEEVGTVVQVEWHVEDVTLQVIDLPSCLAEDDGARGDVHDPDLAGVLLGLHEVSVRLSLRHDLHLQRGASVAA